jgi:uncharacterized protein YhbP (UPF0306 family)
VSHHPTPVATQENDFYIIALNKTHHDLVHSNNSRAAQIAADHV